MNSKTIDRILTSIEAIAKISGDTLNRDECRLIRQDCSTRICNKLTALEERLSRRGETSDSRWREIIEHMQRTDDRLGSLFDMMNEHKIGHNGGGRKK